MALADFIDAIPDFPQPGAIFRDMTPLLQSESAFREAVDIMAGHLAAAEAEAVATIEGRGFLFGGAVARELDLGLLLLCRPGKLPRRTVRVDYAREFGGAAIEVHAEDVTPDLRYGLVDDLLASGGTASAAVQAIRTAGGEVATATFLIELAKLGGAFKLDCPVRRVLDFD